MSEPRPEERPGDTLSEGDDLPASKGAPWVIIALVGCGALVGGVALLGLVVSMFLVPTEELPDRAREIMVRSDLQVIEMAQQMFHTEHGRYPASLEELVHGPPDPLTGVATIYLEEIPIDPWSDKPYLMILGADSKPYYVSLGADQAEGGEGLNKDVSSKD